MQVRETGVQHVWQRAISRPVAAAARLRARQHADHAQKAVDVVMYVFTMHTKLCIQWETTTAQSVRKEACIEMEIFW